jgi:predicted O-methyltransferase YrrM
MTMLPHFVITRLGLCVYSEQWFARMIELYEAVTLSSLAHQTSSNFTWLITVDADMPAHVRHRLESVLRPYPTFHLVSIDVTRLSHLRQGCFDWVWDRCQDFILERGLLTDPSAYVTTSLIDADDAWHEDVISTVNQFMSERLPHACVGEEHRGTWLRHTSGIAATFPRGYRWFIAANALETVHDPFMSMSVFVAARFSSGISACSSRHRAWPSYCDVLAFDMSELAPDRPMWVYARHDLTTQPWNATAVPPLAASLRDGLYRDFGLDADKVQRWSQGHRRHARAGTPSTAHAGRDASAQYDRVFRIAALNRQIEALQRRRGMPGDTAVDGDPSLDDAIADSEVRRALLIDQLRAHGGDTDPSAPSLSTSPTDRASEARGSIMNSEIPFEPESYFVGKELTTDWTSRNYHLWADLLAPRRREPLRILEIGSWEGRSALFFLNYLPRASIVCVDTFAGSVEHRAWPWWQRVRQLKRIERRFDRNLAPFAPRVRKLKDDSLSAIGVLGLEGQRFDVVYVDGSHVAIDVYRDGVLAWPLVARGGLLIFDDYQRKRGLASDLPHIGIDAFLETVSGHYEELFRGHQIIIRKVG